MLMSCSREKGQRAPAPRPETTTPPCWTRPPTAASWTTTQSQSLAPQRSVVKQNPFTPSWRYRGEIQWLSSWKAQTFALQAFALLAFAAVFRRRPTDPWRSLFPLATAKYYDFLLSVFRGGVSPAAFVSAMERAALTTSWFTGSPARNQRRGRYLSGTSVQRAYRWKRRWRAFTLAAYSLCWQAFC